MQPGERINILKKLAAKLGDQTLEDVRLTLRQFGFQDGYWNESDEPLYGFVLRMLENGGQDEALLSLHEYLYLDAAIAPAPSGNWEPGQFRLFMSHVSAKKTAVAAVKAALSRYAIHGFVAHEDIEPTKEWVSEILDSLETCHGLAAFLTPGFHESNWTDQEIGYCIKRRVLVIPIRLGTDPYGFISRYQALTPVPPTADVVAKGLFDILLQHPLTSAQLSDAIVTQFGNSFSFERARWNAELLEKISHWTPDMLTRITGAVAKNYENANAFGVPERIRKIVERHGR